MEIVPIDVVARVFKPSAKVVLEDFPTIRDSELMKQEIDLGKIWIVPVLIKLVPVAKP